MLWGNIFLDRPAFVDLRASATARMAELVRDALPGLLAQVDATVVRLEPTLEQAAQLDQMLDKVLARVDTTHAQIPMVLDTVAQVNQQIPSVLQSVDQVNDQIPAVLAEVEQHVNVLASGAVSLLLHLPELPLQQDVETA